VPHVFTGRAKESRQGLLPVKYIPSKLNPAIFLVLLRPTSANKVLLPAPNGRNGMRFKPVSVKLIVAQSYATLLADVCLLLVSAGGFSHASETGSQLRISPLQRCGLRALASSYTSRQAASMPCSCPSVPQGVTDRMAQRAFTNKDIP